jgi:L-alanine-DL-glutamate epimerase-like enolase superfamily enzyme
MSTRHTRARDDEAAGSPEPGRRIQAIDTWACRMELAVPISFGDHVISSREYAAVRLTTADGIISDAVGLTRKAPVDLAVSDVLGPILLGRDSLDLVGARTAMRRGTRALGMDGIVARAASLLELCLWDSHSQRLGAPLWQLLGGVPRTLPVQVVEGYPLPGERLPAFADRIRDRVEQGFTAVKLEVASEPSPAAAGRKLAFVRQEAGPEVQLIADMAYFWDSPDEAVAAVGGWHDARLTWLEDPMPRDRASAMADLRARSGIPIGAGDESTRPAELAALLDNHAVDVLRIDLTTLGDLSAAEQLAGAAHARGIKVSPHVHPEIHRHIALAWPGIDRVEAFPLDRPFDLLHELIEAPMMADVSAGHVPPPSGPGLGMSLNLQAVRRTSLRSGSLRHRILHASTAPDGGTP